MANARIPIIGQPEIYDYFVTLAIRCSCGNHLLLVGLIGAVRQCGECKKIYRLNGLPSFDPQGHIQAPLGIGSVAAVPADKTTPPPTNPPEA